MRFLILSDLHLELGSGYAVPEGLEYDAVILAGDIQSPGTRGVLWAQRESTFGGRPVILVPGNHEFYGRELTSELASMRDAAAGSNVHVLDRSCVDLGGVRVLGCTLWTDFALHVGNSGEPTSFHERRDVARALEEANRGMNDFRRITLTVAGGWHASVRDRSPEWNRPPKRLLQAEDTLAWHWVHRDWLGRQQDAQLHFGPTIAVTHHAPSQLSIPTRYRSDWLAPAFASELPWELFAHRSLWVHGHTHSPADYTVNGCRVVCNPRGYRMKNSAWENHTFNPGLVIEVPA